MKEVTGNLWTYPADVRVITTNGTVKKNGECVMGRGCAAEAKRAIPGIALALGRKIQNLGNRVFFLGNLSLDPIVHLYSFPVKHNWYEKADIALIEQSAYELMKELSDGYDDPEVTIVLPRPGCGNGGLKWEDVRPVLEPILDDRFHVITFK
jgi:hypothetical protein